MMRFSIWIVDDDEMIRDGIAMAMTGKYRIEKFMDAETCLDALKKNTPDLILMDIGLPGMDGVAALEKIKEIYPNILVVMITAYEEIDTVISAMKLGAYDYVVKPLKIETLELTIGNALQTIRLHKEVLALQQRYLQENLPCFIGESRAIQDIMSFLAKVAMSPDTPVLIHGETGTGKELIASAIHYRSPNFQGPFVPVNCAALPKDLIESELFGYERGAFTGAHTQGKKGLIETAANGTLFLDEVGDLPLEAQAKLLRFMESFEFYKVGGTQKKRIKTRIVSATNRNLKDMISSDLFRKDLYFRLGVIRIDLPTLHERPEDIMPLVKHFLVQFNKKFKKGVTRITAEAESALLQFRWEGNVRELKNMMERAVLITQDSILTLQDLGLDSSDPIMEGQTNSSGALPEMTETGIDFNLVQTKMAIHYYKKAMEITQGNEVQAAKLLNLNYHTFRYNLKKMDLK